MISFRRSERRELLLSEGPGSRFGRRRGVDTGSLSPVAIGHRRLVDGGVLNNRPISNAGELGASLGRQGVGRHLTLVMR